MNNRVSVQQIAMALQQVRQVLEVPDGPDFGIDGILAAIGKLAGLQRARIACIARLAGVSFMQASGFTIKQLDDLTRAVVNLGLVVPLLDRARVIGAREGFMEAEPLLTEARELLAPSKHEDGTARVVWTGPELAALAEEMGAKREEAAPAKLVIPNEGADELTALVHRLREITGEEYNVIRRTDGAREVVNGLSETELDRRAQYEARRAADRTQREILAKLREVVGPEEDGRVAELLDKLEDDILDSIERRQNGAAYRTYLAHYRATRGRGITLPKTIDRPLTLEDDIAASLGAHDGASGYESKGLIAVSEAISRAMYHQPPSAFGDLLNALRDKALITEQQSDEMSEGEAMALAAVQVRKLHESRADLAATTLKPEPAAEPVNVYVQQTCVGAGDPAETVAAIKQALKRTMAAKAAEPETPRVERIRKDPKFRALMIGLIADSSKIAPEEMQGWSPEKVEAGVLAIEAAGVNQQMLGWYLDSRKALGADIERIWPNRPLEHEAEDARELAWYREFFGHVVGYLPKPGEALLGRRFFIGGDEFRAALADLGEALFETGRGRTEASDSDRLADAAKWIRRLYELAGARVKGCSGARYSGKPREARRGRR